MPQSSSFAVLNKPVSEVAPRLLGCILERELDGHILRVRIVETEAYDQTDAASHSYKWKTPRTAVMFGPPGHLYVYFTYGMHYCCNIVVGPVGQGAAVLIRAVEPLAGTAVMSENRHGRGSFELTNGPAKLCQALAIDKALNGHNLEDQPLRLIIKKRLPNNAIIQTTRVGISQAQDIPWRFYIRDNPYVSAPAAAR
jgi:DNA-3-methyladenine glycosylase